MKTRLSLKGKLSVGGIVFFVIILFLCIRPSVWLSDQRLFETIFSISYPSTTAIGPIIVNRSAYDWCGNYVFFNFRLSPAEFNTFTEKPEIGYDAWKPFNTELSVGDLWLSDDNMPSAIWLVSEHGHSHRFIVANRKTFQIYAVYFRTGR
jgi:hypothetical protein